MYTPESLHEQFRSLWTEQPQNNCSIEQLFCYVVNPGRFSGQPSPEALVGQCVRWAEQIGSGAAQVTNWNLALLGWMLHQLPSVGNETLTKAADLVDTLIFQKGQADFRQGRVGLLGGSLALNYFAEGDPKASAPFLSSLLDIVFESAVSDEQGFRIWPDDQPGYVPFSLQDGQAGLLLTLLKLSEQRPTDERLLSTVRNGIYYLNLHRLPVDFLRQEYTFYPIAFHEFTRQYDLTDSLHWAQGDLNMALLLYRGAHRLHDDSLFRLAEFVGTFSLLRNDADSTGVQGSAIRNGAMGLALTYQALFAYSANARYRAASQHWMQQTILLLQNDGPPASSPPLSLLDGLSGVQLGLDTCSERCAGHWKRLLLL